MTENEGHFEKDLDLKVSDRLSADLASLYKPDREIPPEVDRAVMEKVNRCFIRRQPRRLLRWAGPVAAAAAVIICVFMVNTSKRSGPASLQDEYKAVRSRAASALVGADVDGSGRVDILDAFKLARRIESAGSVDKKWDMNGDGVVNRKDVDTVAFAAVRLDKGVL